MNEIEKAYIAGLFDGEGCFRIERFKTARSPIGFQYRSIAEIAMCDEAPIKFLAKITKKKYASKPIPSGRTVFIMTYRNGIAADLIRNILPYLHGKKDQAELCLYFEDHVTPGRGKTYKPQDKAVCDDLLLKVRALKQNPALRC